MSASFSGVLPVVGPLAPAPYVPQRGLLRCDCDPTTGMSCDWCDGTEQAEWEAELAARPATKARKDAMRTDPAYRRKWLETFPAGRERAEMAAHADRIFGQLPLGTVDTSEAA